MKINRLVSGSWIEVSIDKMINSDFSQIGQNKEFVFEWDLERKQEVYKLYISDDESKILGLLSVRDYPEELRIHINLIEVIKSQVGKHKTIGNIAGCLIAYACSLAFKRGYGGFFFFPPKKKII